jgi:uncharacterized protein YbjQ (UPF0145 family)
MLISKTETLPGYTIKELKGLVQEKRRDSA